MIYSRLARTTVISLLLAAMCHGSLASASSPVNDKAKVVYTVRQMFAALTNDDLDLLKSVTTTDFYAFDGAQRS